MMAEFVAELIPMGRCYRPAFLFAVLLCLPACSRPPQRLIEECRQTAIHEGFGHQLNSDDIGELTEVCMASKGFALREIGKRCTEDMPTAMNPECYYRDSLFGRMSKVF